LLYFKNSKKFYERLSMRTPYAPCGTDKFR
jgi:hypothetical protein